MFKLSSRNIFDLSFYIARKGRVNLLSANHKDKAVTRIVYNLRIVGRTKCLIFTATFKKYILFALR